MTNTKSELLARDFIKRGSSFECALGVAMLQGNYNDRCRIINAFPRKVANFRRYYRGWEK